MVGSCPPAVALSPRAPVADSGLVFVQIDGLAEAVLRQALAAGAMPTLARWLRGGTHRLASWKAGLPSETSASQAGLLHGNDWDIPGFRWYEKERRHLVSSGVPADAVVGVSGNLAHVYFAQLAGRRSYEEIEERFPGMIAGLVGHPGIGYVLTHSRNHGPLALSRYIWATAHFVPLAGTVGPHIGSDHVPVICALALLASPVSRPLQLTTEHT
jgi:hypothetical protein